MNVHHHDQSNATSISKFILNQYINSFKQYKQRQMMCVCVLKTILLLPFFFSFGNHGLQGAVSVRFRLHETSFCFVCCHLASGGREGDEKCRNSNVAEILSRTRFPRSHSLDLPRKILDHEYVIYVLTTLQTNLLIFLLVQIFYFFLLLSVQIMSTRRQLCNSFRVYTALNIAFFQL
jgi:hypothetical protein